MFKDEVALEEELDMLKQTRNSAEERSRFHSEEVAYFNDLAQRSKDSIVKPRVATGNSLLAIGTFPFMYPVC